MVAFLSMNREAQRLGKTLLGTALFVLIMMAASPASAAELKEPAGSAETVAPLLVGSPVPAAKVKTLDGTDVDLASLLSEKRAILIFYRGGW